MREESATPAVAWRARLEARWQAWLREVTELSLAYHAVAPASADVRGDGADRLMRRAVAARRRLADVEDALARLAAGTFGRCEQCGATIGEGTLALVPETRYCPACAALAARMSEAAGLSEADAVSAGRR
jgi:RNA polymerase-binding transcription factor DksA